MSNLDRDAQHEPRAVPDAGLAQRRVPPSCSAASADEWRPWPCAARDVAGDLGEALERADQRGREAGITVGVDDDDADLVADPVAQVIVVGQGAQHDQRAASVGGVGGRTAARGEDHREHERDPANDRFRQQGSSRPVLGDREPSARNTHASKAS
jgi:hypothetical protein